MKYEDIKEGSILYDKQHEVRVIAKVNDVDQFDNITPAIEIEYLNQPSSWSPQLTGSGNLSEESLHCWNCQDDLIDTVRLDTCHKCRRVICPNCHKCHCDTTWDPNR